MPKILIFGNSSSGKSSLAKQLAAKANVALLDLDTIAWQAFSPEQVPQRATLADSAEKIAAFTKANASWLVEGCYSDLLELLAEYAEEIIFMDLSVADCRENARNRPWEPHKYKSKQQQDDNLQMLLSWIGQYSDRSGSDSHAAHCRFYESFSGTKTRHRTNLQY